MNLNRLPLKLRRASKNIVNCSMLESSFVYHLSSFFELFHSMEFEPPRNIFSLLARVAVDKV